MTNPEHRIADAIRDVTAEVLNTIEAGSRSRQIDAHDLVEVLLAIADRLDPQVRVIPDRVRHPCPDCKNADPDTLEWLDDEFVRCDVCGTIYAPGKA